MKFAVVIPTYERADGMTPQLLRRTLDSIFNQMHNDFRVFLIGDDYTHPEVILDMIKNYDDRLYFQNLPVAVERQKYANDQERLWCNGGNSATNVGVQQALSEGYRWICRLDHDDWWLPDHLSVLNIAIEATQGVWFCTLAQADNGIVLPKIDSLKKISAIPFLPKPGGIFKSSTCYDQLSIDVWGRDCGAIPVDYDMWQRMEQYIKEHNLKSYCINKITCRYGVAGYERYKKI